MGTHDPGGAPVMLKREIRLTLEALAAAWPGLVLVIGFALVTWFVNGR
jgi:hypothetical protein